MEIWRFIEVPDDLILVGEHQLELVLASWFIASLAGYCALCVKDFLVHSNKSAIYWLTVGAVAMGMGIWAMHFTGMLAFQLPVHMVYDPLMTALSILPAVVGSACALKVLASNQPHFWRLQTGGLLLAFGISTMHFTGMAAMQMHGADVAYDFWLFGLSVFLAHVLATLALTVRFALRDEATLWHKIVAAGCIGGAVAGMHYTAMSAAIFYRAPMELPLNSWQIPHEAIAVLVITASVCLLTAVIVATRLDRRYVDSKSNANALAVVIPDGIIVVDQHLEIQSANPAANDMFGYQSDQLLHKSLSLLITQWDSATQLTQLSLCRDESVWGTKADGSRIRLEATVVPQVEDGKVRHVIVLRDVTERLERERNVRRLATALEQAQDGVVITDIEGSCVYTNGAATSLVDSLPGRICPGLSFVFDDQTTMRTISDEGHWTGKCKLDRDGGICLDVSVSPITTDEFQAEANPPLEYLVVLRDVTAQERLEDQLRQSQKLESIGQLASGIAHEINTPAQYVADNVAFLGDAWVDIQPVLLAMKKLGESEAPLQEIWDDADVDYLLEEAPEAFEHCTNGLHQIKKIVSAMKKFAHPGEDQKEASDINDLLDNTSVIARNEWKYIADMDFDFADDLTEVFCVRSAINQVFLNMIVNAAHAIQDRFGSENAQGKISISTKNIDDAVEIRIQDNGAGVPEEIRQKIFDPFYTTKEVGRGSGQGLSIAYSVIVEGHGGSIELESAVDEGTTFIIRLPNNSPAKNLQRPAA